ncbi:MAG: ATP-binding protein [Acidimicrobiia bacterium]|nr:ATP-binding protein [Acidimicrobiia bacterium]
MSGSPTVATVSSSPVAQAAHGRRRAAGWSAPSIGLLEVLERATVLAQLAGLLDPARRTRGHIALIVGEAGIGKSTLVETFCADRSRVHSLWWGGCDSVVPPRPFAPLVDIAEQVGGSLKTSLAAGDRNGILDAVLTLILQPDARDVVVLEDLHWADDATLDLLRVLGRRMRGVRTLVVGTYRHDEVDEDHPQLVQEVAACEPSAIAECITRGMLVGDGDSLRFRHQLAELAVAEARPAAERVVLDLRALRALEREGADPAVLARHAVAAGDPSAFRLARAAADRAAHLGAHREAAAHYGIALSMSAAVGSRVRGEVLEAHARESSMTDHVEHALASQREALAVWRRLGNPLRQGDCMRSLPERSAGGRPRSLPAHPGPFRQLQRIAGRHRA